MRKTAAFASGATALACTLVVLSAAPAWAATTYAGSSAAQAFQLTAGGQSLIAGAATAQAASNMTASATGTAYSSPSQSQSQTASASASSPTASKPQACSTPPFPALPAPLPSLQPSAACSSASASVTGGLPTAQAAGSFGGLSASLASALGQVLQPIQGPLQSVFGKLPSQLNPVSSTVNNLLSALGATQTLSVTVGQATASVAATQPSVVSSSATPASQIEILPNGATGGGPVAVIDIGSASAKATFDQVTGALVPQVSGAVVTVTVDTAATGKVSNAIAPGQSQTILQGTPLQSTITVGDATTAHNPNGSVTATANGVKLSLLQGVGASPATSYNGGFTFTFAQAQATVGGTIPPPVTTTTTTSTTAAPPVTAAPAPPAPKSLPFTGEPAWVPFAGIGSAGMALATSRAKGWLRRFRRRG